MTREPTAQELSGLSPLELLQQFAGVIDELKVRGIVRTLNNPLADYTEWLVSSRMGLSLLKSSRSGYDAVGPDGTRYQIKGRRVLRSSRIIQMSALRGLATKPFDILIAIVFESDFTIRHALSIPHAVVIERAVYQAYTNSHQFYVRESVLRDERIEDIGGRLF